jgi:hypothetical protein
MIDSTVGGAAANSYSSLSEANTYHSTRLHNAEWSAASNATREQALMMATSYLDALGWKGTKFSSEQALRWPRSGVLDLDGQEYSIGSIPKPLLKATAEMAWELIKSDRTVDPDSSGLKSVKAGPVEVEFDKMTTPTTIPMAVKHYLLHLLEPGYGGAFAKLVRA